MSEYVEIERIIRPMRGQSRAFLALGTDQNFYVVKQAQDIYQQRLLTNECLGHAVLRSLSISSPDIQTIHVRNADSLVAHTNDGPGTILQNGHHFGSRVPVDPTKTMIYDFMPRTLMPRVKNHCEFATTFAVDVWLCNSSPRQEVFFFETANDGSRQLKAFFIDNDHLLCGAEWRIDATHVDVRWRDSLSLQGLPAGELCVAAVEAIRGLDMNMIREQTTSLASYWLTSEERSVLCHRFELLNQKRFPLAHQIQTILTMCESITVAASGDP